MKILFFISLFALIGGQAWAQKLTTEQENKVREVVQKYCELLQELCQKPNDADPEPILKLFTNPRVNTYDDSGESYKELSIQLYINKLVDVPKQELSVQYAENIKQQPIEAVKNCGKTIANISLSKKINFIGAKRIAANVTNNFYLSFENEQWKIYGIGREVQENADIESLTAFEVWQKTLKQLGGKGKQWKNAKNLVMYQNDNGGIAPLRYSNADVWETKIGEQILEYYTYKGLIKKIKFLGEGVAEFEFVKGKTKKATYCIAHDKNAIVFTFLDSKKDVSFEIQKLSNFSLAFKVPNPDFGKEMERNGIGLDGQRERLGKVPYWLYAFEAK